MIATMEGLYGGVLEGSFFFFEEPVLTFNTTGIAACFLIKRKFEEDGRDEDIRLRRKASVFL